MIETIAQTRESRSKQIRDFLIKINLFENKEALSLVDQIFATRIFVSLMIINLTIIIIFTAFTTQTQTVTIQSPSEDTFKQLASQYPSTLSCPCQQSSIFQNDFLSFNPQYHPVCTSQLINQTFISSLSDTKMSDYWPLDYRIMIASHFQILAALCQTIKQTILDAITESSIEHIITNRVLLPDIFDAQIAALVDQLKTTTVATSKYINDFIWFNIFQNGFYSGLRTNYYTQVLPENLQTSSFPDIYLSLTGTCSCLRNGTCVHQAGIYNWTGRSGVNSSTIYGSLTTDPPLLFNIPGLMVGCLPYNSFLQSTLECFYNQSCIDLIQPFINNLQFISPLSSSQFLPTTTVNNLLDQLFIESWNNQSSFTDYFRICFPYSCTYSYNRRFNLIYIIVTIISLFGGMKVILILSAPFIVNIIRRIQTIRNHRNRVNEITITYPNQSFKDRFLSFMRQVYQQIVTLNMFPLSSNIKDGIYSTRFYILFLFIGVLIFVFYASISVRTQTITINQPSLNEYERLYAKYSSTLVCPCSHLSVSYSSIMYTQPRYHQVCSSDFIDDDRWLLYTHGLPGPFYSLDFRVVGIGLFTILQTLCKMSNETVIDQLVVFNDTQFVSAQVLANDTFNMQTSILIQQFQQQIADSFISLFNIIQVSTLVNQFITAGNTNARLAMTQSNNDMSIRFVSRNDYDNSCSCGKTSTCQRSQGFYCTSPNCFVSTAKPNQTIPGLVINCLPVDSLLLSSLQCIYNKSCIQMLIQWSTFGLSNITIDPRAANVTPLDSMINSRFPPNTTLITIAPQLFIEDWTNSIDFSSYYNQCAPSECTYSYDEGLNRAYIISTVFGTIGGLSVALRILILPIVKLFRRIYYRCRKPRLHTERQAVVQMTVIARVQRYIQTMNYYHKTKQNWRPEETQTNEEILLTQRQRIATRFYIIVLFLGIIILLLFTGLSSQIHSITVSSPSESTFEQLQTQYSSTLFCPCSQIAIEYSKFLSIQVSAYHQICSSYYISSTFISLLRGTERSSSYYWSIDLKILSTQFRLLSALCSITRSAINSKIQIFLSEEFISIETLTRNSFEIQMNSIIENFIIQIPTTFPRTHKYINNMLHANQLHNVFYTNWNLIFSNPNENYIMKTNPKQYNGSKDFCSCDTSSTCSKSILTSYNYTVNLSGLVLGCLPIFGLRQSTVECLYDSTCLDRLAHFADIHSILNPLNVSVITRFTPIPSISFGTLIDELFIEFWQNTSNYSNYFTNCAPLTCRYTYVERNNVLYMLTTFLGLYGGLTVGSKIIIWNTLLIYWNVYRCFIDRKKFQPMTNNW